ncbi:hypothetical protein [Janthinobacterium sp. HLS12-2]|uniref:hypothetical protein n=1 Tax=Janthinobacterium sp. HLS12-2 TaxID=1259324 RepID=UPI003F28023F
MQLLAHAVHAAAVFAILSRLREHGRFQKVRAAVKAHRSELLATPDLMARYPC